MLVAAMWGAVAALPLLLGAWYALRRHPSDRIVGLVSAFGAGALLSAVAFELVEDASTQSSPIGLAVALGIGSVTYYIGDRVLSDRSASAEDAGARGRALLFGAALDGIPESFILGQTTAVGGAVSIAFLVAVIASNLPEGMASAAELAREPGASQRRILGMWLVVIAVSAVAAALGAVSAGLPGVTGASAQAFAAGALLTMLVDDLVPEARELGGLSAGLVSTLGFAVAFGLHQLGG